MLALSREEPGTLGGKEDIVVSPQAWISVVCLFLSSWNLPTGRGNELLVECACVHAIPFVPTKNGCEGSRIHRFPALSAFSYPRIVSFPDDMPLTLMTRPLPNPPASHLLFLPFCNSRLVPLRTSWWPALQSPGSKSGSTQKRRRDGTDVYFLEVLG